MLGHIEGILWYTAVNSEDGVGVRAVLDVGVREVLDGGTVVGDGDRDGDGEGERSRLVSGGTC